jgi:hypothetical protein
MKEWLPLLRLIVQISGLNLPPDMAILTTVSLSLP